MKYFLMILAAASVLSQSAFATNREELNEMFPEQTETTGVEQFALFLGEYMAFNYMQASTEGVVPFNDLNIKAKTAELKKAEATYQELLANGSEKRIKLAEERMQTIENQLNELRTKSAEQTLKTMKRSNLIKSISFVGRSLIIADMFGRLYVWSSLDRDPTVTPLGTYFYKKLNK